MSANYLLRRIAALFNEKDGTDDGKRMASNWEVILTPFLTQYFMLELLKNDLKNLLRNSGHEEVFRCLLEQELQPDCGIFQDALAISSRYASVKRAEHQGTIDFREKTAV